MKNSEPKQPILFRRNEQDVINMIALQYASYATGGEIPSATEIIRNALQQSIDALPPAVAQKSIKHARRILAERADKAAQS